MLFSYYVTDPLFALFCLLRDAGKLARGSNCLNSLKETENKGGCGKYLVLIRETKK
jgi:hypothetical protein